MAKPTARANPSADEPRFSVPDSDTESEVRLTWQAAGSDWVIPAQAAS